MATDESPACTCVVCGGPGAERYDNGLYSHQTCWEIAVDELFSAGKGEMPPAIRERARTRARAARAMATEDTHPAYDDLAAMIREIAEGDPLRDDYDSTPLRCCRYCDRAMVSRHHEYRPEYRVHAPDCLWLKCCALAARLPTG